MKAKAAPAQKPQPKKQESKKVVDAKAEEQKLNQLKTFKMPKQKPSFGKGETEMDLDK